MRLLFLFLAFFYTSPAWAEEDHNIYEEQALKEKYRQCKVDDDCTYTHNVCSGYLAVSKKSKEFIEKQISDLKVLSKCALSVPAPAPLVTCTHNVCAIRDPDSTH